MVGALKDSMTQEVERIFRLLKLLFPRFDLHSAFVGLQSTNHEVHDNSLEFLESILKPQLRSLMVPLIDSEVSIPERVRRATQLVGAEVLTQRAGRRRPARQRRPVDEVVRRLRDRHRSASRRSPANSTNGWMPTIRS